MATDTRSPARERWTGLGSLPTSGAGAWAIRAGLTVLAFGSLWLSQVAAERFRTVSAEAFRFDLRLWSATITPFMLAGLFFTVAACYGSPRPQRGRGRLVLGLLALLPAIHLGFIMWAPQFNVHWPVILITPRWWDAGEVPFACAVLTGVAVGVGFGAPERRGSPA